MTAPESPNQLKRAALMAAMMSSLVTPLMVSSVNIALPDMERSFNLDAITLSWVATAYLLSAAVFLVPLGRLADIFGRRRVYFWGMIVFTASSLVCAVAPSAAWLLIGRAVQGLGSSMVFATGVAILTSVYPPGERGRALGLSVAMVYAGLSIGPFVGGFLTNLFGWRAVFWLNLPLGLITIIVIAIWLRGEWAEAAGEKFDLIGAAIYGLSLAGLLYAFSALPAPWAIGLAAASVAGLGLFVWWETKSDQPVFEVRLFITNRVFALSSLAAMIHYSATSALTFLLSLYLQSVKGLNPQSAGLILVIQPVLMALFAPLSGRLSDRVEPRIVASLGMAVTGLGVALYLLLDPDTSVAYIMTALAVTGFGFAFFSSPNINAIMSSVEKRHLGIASGSMGTTRLLGQMFSMGIATVIFAVMLGRVQIAHTDPADFTATVRVCCAVFACLCGLGIMASLARGNLHPAGRDKA